MPRAQAVRRTVEVSSKILDCPDVVAYGVFREVATLEFLQHHFSKMGHRNTSCDPHLYPSPQATNAGLPHAKRPPRSGYVLTRLSSMWELASTCLVSGHCIASRVTSFVIFSFPRIAVTVTVSP